MNIEEMKENAAAATSLLRSLANERRLLLLCQLTEGEKSVGELSSALGLTQSATSQQLSNLRKDDLVITRRDGQVVYYSLADGDIASILETLHGVFCS